MTAGITGWGSYLPYWRLPRAAIAGVLGSGGGQGSRAVASYDEDTTTLGVEAGRRALAGPFGAAVPRDLFFSTPAPGYLDKTSATTIHAALGLDRGGAAYDFAGSSRSAIGTLVQALGGSAGRASLTILSDLRTGLAGGAEERDAGDGGVAFLCGDESSGGATVAELIGRGSSSDEFLDRWRVPGEQDSHVWEERFGEERYVPLAREAFADALKEAGVTESDVDHAIVAGLHGRAVKAVAGSLGVAKEAMAPDLSSTVGNLGAAQAGLALADVLERARPGRVIVVLSLADGADALVLRTTEALPATQAAYRSAGVPTVAEQVDAGGGELSYAAFLTWRGQLHREPPRRPDPERPGAPTVYRSESWKYAFAASTCTACGFRHMPPTRVCLSCQAVDQMQAERLADTAGTVATFTIDHLAYSLSPPVIGVIVDFDGGGRYRCELTDADAARVAIGDRVEMTFRRVYTALGVHNYFWKARPLRGGATGRSSEGTSHGQ